MEHVQTLSDMDLAEAEQRIRSAHADLHRIYPGYAGQQPVHVFYGGAHLFHAGTPAKLGMLALRSMDDFAPDTGEFAAALSLDPSISLTLYERVRQKLMHQPIEDLRIDFEDGYGIRSDVEEDHHASGSAGELAQALIENSGWLPPFLGIRIKPLNPEFYRRSIRTLDIFLSELVAHLPRWGPKNFCITLPKVALLEEVETLAQMCGKLEDNLKLPPMSLRIELMVERTQAILNDAGSVQVLPLVRAAGKRCTSVHFGPYDYAASRNLSVPQPVTHFAAHFAREVMQVALGGTGVRVVDGPTNVLPIAPHGNMDATMDRQQRVENMLAVQSAWRLHFDHVRQALSSGIYQGWDLHPAQLPVRYAATYSFFLERLRPVADRLKHFIRAASQATRIGQVFDDTAMAQGLMQFIAQAVRCGAIAPETAEEMTELSAAQLQEGSFLKILSQRK